MNRLKLQDRVAIITGAGSGMGRAIAHRYAAEGAKVVVNDYNQQAAQETVDQIKQKGGEARVAAADISRLEQVNQVIQTAVGGYGGLDILVNNAGVFDGSKPVTETTDELWNQILGVNLNGAFWGIRSAIPHMLRRGGGVIINVASIAGQIGAAGGAAYTTSKHAMLGLTKHVAVAYGPQGIRANTICPGAIITGMLPEEFLQDKANPMVQKILSVPARRAGTADEIASLALFLASDESAFIHGQAITIDGGWVIQA